eukprot:42091-Hanusia_phi.AAC.2
MRRKRRDGRRGEMEGGREGVGGGGERWREEGKGWEEGEMEGGREGVGGEEAQGEGGRMTSLAARLEEQETRLSAPSCPSKFPEDVCVD